MTQQLSHRRGFHGQIAVLGIAFQQFPPFEKAPDAACDEVCQLGKPGGVRCLHPAKSGQAVGALPVHAIEKQHMEMVVSVGLTAEALDQRDRTGVCGAGFLAGLIEGCRHPTDELSRAQRTRYDAGTVGCRFASLQWIAQCQQLHGSRFP